MIDLIKNNKVTVLIIALIIGGGIWFSMSGGTPEEALLVSEDATGVRSAQERVALDTLVQLKSIQITGNIFSDPAFQSLRDARTEIVAEPVGRRNPFAPLGKSGTSASTTPTAAPANR